ncbi:DUF503 domain-containing protein [Aestuariirhabdus sp. Z084]|uniref:DUF503 domain-containing protein n=1 Tax=Aestuariirhabdus haliotis TaxID=2918751 RepID=UPI00201B3711|nr:DUF503 domain-containing protein [Aestuariirhabdus haliotis]MCL6417085.1 DUF503 domain-containing protein [Aestuariirhabdus haliotis]MCL6420625.1 DUF503 domain-containing protein [Aestuariirhabdus haliotis]
MQIAVLVLDFHLPGCRSLKEKRQRLGGLRDRVGKQSQLAVAESDKADLHQQAQWTVLILGSTRAQVMQRMEQVLNGLQDYDAVLCNQQLEWL